MWVLVGALGLLLVWCIVSMVAWVALKSFVHVVRKPDADAFGCTVLGLFLMLVSLMVFIPLVSITRDVVGVLFG